MLQNRIGAKFWWAVIFVCAVGCNLDDGVGLNGSECTGDESDVPVSKECRGGVWVVVEQEESDAGDGELDSGEDEEEEQECGECSESVHWEDVGHEYGCCDGESACERCRDQREMIMRCNEGECEAEPTGNSRTLYEECEHCEVFDYCEEMSSCRRVSGSADCSTEGERTRRCFEYSCAEGGQCEVWEEVESVEPCDFDSEGRLCGEMSGFECVDGECECTEENTLNQVCSEVGWECGYYMAADGCGGVVMGECGPCPSGNVCLLQSNRCCDPSTGDPACAE